MLKWINRALESQKRIGRYPSCDHLNQALGDLLMDYETNRFAIEEICHAIRKADGYFYSYIASLMHVYGFSDFLKGANIDADD